MQSDEANEEVRHIAHQIMFEAMVANGVAIGGNQLWPSHPEPKDPIHFVIIENGSVWYSKFFSGGAYEPALGFLLEGGKFYIDSSTRGMPHGKYHSPFGMASIDIHDPALLNFVFKMSMTIFVEMQTDRKRF